MFNLTEGQTLEEFIQGVKKSFESGEVVNVLNRGLNNDISILGIENIDKVCFFANVLETSMLLDVFF